MSVQKPVWRFWGNASNYSMELRGSNFQIPCFWHLCVTITLDRGCQRSVIIAMAISTRRKRFTNAMAALSLLASFSYLPCRAFVATRSLTLQQDRRRSGVVNTSNLFVGWKTCSYRGVEVRGCRVPSSRATSMLAPPPELWSSYLQALEVAPLLTKVPRTT